MKKVTVYGMDIELNKDGKIDLELLTDEQREHLAEGMTMEAESKGFYSSTFTQLSRQQIKSLLAGHYLYDVPNEELGRLYDLLPKDVERVLGGDVALFDDIMDEFFEENEEQLGIKVDDAIESMFGVQDKAEPKQESMRDYLLSLEGQGLSREEIIIKSMQRTMELAEERVQQEQEAEVVRMRTYVIDFSK